MLSLMIHWFLDFGSEARTLLGAPGLTTRSKKLLGAPGIAASNNVRFSSGARWFYRLDGEVLASDPPDFGQAQRSEAVFSSGFWLLVVTSALLVVTGALLVETRS